MPAIKIHHTATDNESAWDGPGEVAKASNDEATLRYMHAWVDDAGDPVAKNSYKFPHHAAGDGMPANIAGVNSALARLSQANIPEADRAGVEAHLNAHREDAGLQDTLSTKTVVKNHDPIRCFEGSAKPHEPFWRFLDAGESADGEEPEPEMELYGFISEFSWFDDDITPAIFKNDLYAHGAGGPLTIRMNSYGGDVIAASRMRAIIQDYPGRVTVRIDGIAASAATVVATAGDVVKIQDTAYYMIHDPMVMFFLASLNIEDLGRLLREMKSVKDGIVNAYEHKTGLSRGRLASMMTNETWMSAQEAVDLGFADQVISEASPTKKKTTIDQMHNAAMVNALHNYVNVPVALLDQRAPVNVNPQTMRVDPAQPGTPPVGSAGNHQKAADRLRAEVKILKKE